MCVCVCVCVCVYKGLLTYLHTIRLKIKKQKHCTYQCEHTLTFTYSTTAANKPNHHNKSTNNYHHIGQSVQVMTEALCILQIGFEIWVNQHPYPNAEYSTSQ